MAAGPRAAALCSPTVPPEAVADARADAPTDGAAAPSPPWTFAGVVRRLGLTSVLAAGAVVLPPLGSVLLFAYIEQVGSWLRGHGVEGVVIYAGAFMVLTGVAILPTYASAILGGWAFGFAVGYPAAMAGFLGGAAIGYGIARRVTGERVVKLLEDKPAWAQVRRALVGSGFFKAWLIVTLLRLPPNSPFAATNLVLASVRVGPGAFLLGTLVGMAPRTGLVLYLAVSVRDQIAAEAAQQRPWWMIAAGVVLTLIVLAIIGTMARRALGRVTRG